MGGGGVPPHLKWGGGGVSGKIFENCGSIFEIVVAGGRRAAAKFFDSGPAGRHSCVAGRASGGSRLACEAPKFRACGAPVGTVKIAL